MLEIKVGDEVDGSIEAKAKMKAEAEAEAEAKAKAKAEGDATAAAGQERKRELSLEPLLMPQPGGGGVVGGGPVVAVDPATIIGPGVAGASPIPTLMDPGYVLEPVAIALAGGGTLGDFELGALDFIHRVFLGSPAGIAAGFPRSRVDVATGTSVGAVNAGAIAQGGVACLADLKQIWFDMNATEDFYVFNDAIQDVIGGHHDSFGPAIGRILRDLALGALGLGLTGLLPLGLLPLAALGLVGGDLARLYEVLVAQPSIMKFGRIASTARDIESYWSPAGPGLRGTSVAVVRDGHGRRIVFARGYDDRLYARWQLDDQPITATTRWSRWTALGGPISSDPVAYVTTTPAGAGVIARVGDELRYGGRTLDGADDVARVGPAHDAPFLDWENVPLPPGPSVGRFSSQVTVIARPRPTAFCRDENRRAPTSPELNRSYVSVWDGDRWGGWTAFGANPKRIAGNVTGASAADGTLELFARTDDHTLLYSFTAGGGPPASWVHWQLGATSDVLAVLTEAPAYIVDVFWRGTDGQLWSRRKRGRAAFWDPPRALGGLIISNLASGRNPDGSHSIFARGLDDNLWTVRQPAPGAEWPADAWTQLGAPPDLVLAADPCTLAGAAEGIEVYAVASDRGVWTIRQEPDGGYGAWVALGGKLWTGTRLRMCAVALETGEARYVDEAGRFTGTLEPVVSGDGDMRFARSQGALAACTAPGVFPPIALNGRSWVDGGMRYGTPIGAAIAAGATRVIAIATTSSRLARVTPILPRTLSSPARPLADAIAGAVGQARDDERIASYRDAGVVDVLVRSFVELLVDATSWSALAPETPWPVPVWTIQQTFKIHEGGTVDPGLIRINYAYGWMRAFDALVASDDQRGSAMASTDAIVTARWEAWKAEARFREAFLIATRGDMVTPANSDPARTVVARAAALAELELGQARMHKRELGRALLARRALGLPLDPESAGWIDRFERFAVPPHWPLDMATHLPPAESPFRELRFSAVDRSGDHVVEDEPAPRVVT